MVSKLSMLAIVTGLLLLAARADAAQTRCGWYVMPTPGNLLLIDKDASWSITSQGQALGPDAIGVDKAPDFDQHQFVAMNVPGTGYGYGCACMVVDVDAKAHRIVRIYSGTIKPLAACRKDKSLPAPN